MQHTHGTKGATGVNTQSTAPTPLYLPPLLVFLCAVFVIFYTFFLDFDLLFLFRSMCNGDFEINHRNTHWSCSLPSWRETWNEIISQWNSKIIAPNRQAIYGISCSFERACMSECESKFVYKCILIIDYIRFIWRVASHKRILNVFSSFRVLIIPIPYLRLLDSIPF